jgi:hypothetical protein
MMSSTFRVMLVAMLVVCMSVTLIIPTTSSPAGLLARVQPVASPDTPITSSMGHQNSPIVTLTVHAMVPEKIKVSDPAHRTVPATVLAVDKQIDQLKLQTQEGQRLVLYLAPAVLDGLQVGRQIMLQVNQRSVQEVVTERSLTEPPSTWGISDCL